MASANDSQSDEPPTDYREFPSDEWNGADLLDASRQDSIDHPNGNDDYSVVERSGDGVATGQDSVEHPDDGVDYSAFEPSGGCEATGQDLVDDPDDNIDFSVDPYLQRLQSSDPLERIVGALSILKEPDLGSHDFQVHIFRISAELEAMESVPQDFFANVELLDFLISVLPNISTECASVGLYVLCRVLQLSCDSVQWFAEWTEVGKFLSHLFRSLVVTANSHCQWLGIVQEILPISNNVLSDILLHVALSRPFSDYNASDVSDVAPAVFCVIDLFLRKPGPFDLRGSLTIISAYSVLHESHSSFCFLSELCTLSFDPLLAYFQNMDYASHAGFLARFGLRLLEFPVSTDAFFPLGHLVSLVLNPVTDSDDKADISEFVTEFVRHKGLNGLLTGDGYQAFVHFCEEGRPSAAIVQDCMKIWWNAFLSSSFDVRVKFLNDTTLSELFFQSPDPSFVSADQLIAIFIASNDFSYLDYLSPDALSILEAFFMELEAHEDEDFAMASAAIRQSWFSDGLTSDRFE
jgi:hypothetical protein